MLANTNESLQKILADRFQLSTFRKGQLDVIKSVISGQDTLAVMPTGGGKSLCYQIPALFQSGLVIVISPLIALMQDQVRDLQARGIACGSLFSGQTLVEKEQVFRALRGNPHFILYVSPERVQKPGFATWVKTQKITLFAIDEAHCISQWGPDFRQDYHRLQLLRELRPDVPILALTASATPDVLRDIVVRMSLRDPARHIHGFYRDNLFYQVESCADDPEKMDFLAAAVDQVPTGRILIYCGTRQQSQDIAQVLGQRFSGVGYYHAGLESAKRQEIQANLSENRLRILAATNAFGMGINLPDVRLVVHYQMPSSIEAFYQEVGRAGRDSQPARGLLLYARADRGLHAFFIQQSKAESGVISHRWRSLEAITQFVEGGGCRHSGILTYFRDSDRIDRCGHCDVCAPVQNLEVRLASHHLKFPKPVKVKRGKAPPPDKLLTSDAEVRAQCLQDWRRSFASANDLPAFMIFSNRTLTDLANKNPRSLSDLERVYGLGEKKIERFGSELLKVLGRI